MLPICVDLLPLYAPIIQRKNSKQDWLRDANLLLHLYCQTKTIGKMYSWKASEIGLSYQAHHDLSFPLVYDHFQLASSVISKRTIAHSLHNYFLAAKKKNSRSIVVRVVTHNRRYCPNYCIGRLGVLHLRLRYLLEEGWASPMEIYMIRASIGLAVPGLPL